MSSKGGNEHFENFVLFIIVGGLGLAGILYVAYLFIPFLLFYLAPFVVVSLVVGIVLRMAGAPGDGVGSLSSSKAVMTAYAVMLCLVGLVFFQNLDRAKVLDAKGKLTNQVVVDWPELNNWHHSLRVRMYTDAPFESLRAKAKMGVVYDRLEVGWIFLVGMFLGAPLVYWFLARHDEETVNTIVEGLVNERTKSKRDQLKTKEDNLNQIINQSKEKLEAEIHALKKKQAEIMAENQSLKAKLEFAPDIPRPSESVKKDGGVLDQDIF
jgi:hypothetical protein